MIESRGVPETIAWAERVRSANLSLGLVPTMGALHAGHLSLVDGARRECDRVAVSIFVNPTQFGPGEDLDRYPRTPENDLRACRDHGVDFVLLQDASASGEIYAPGFQTWITVEKLSAPLCGRFRPVHFRGVATVVTLLLNIFRPHRAYFGQKDYQQARLLTTLARELHTGTEVRISPTVREEDGLAMSSRNSYLDAAERRHARVIPDALLGAERCFLRGEDRPGTLLAMCRDRLESEPGLAVQYAEVLDAVTLEPPAEARVADLAQGVVLAVAALAGSTRLIDNVWLRAEMRHAGRSNFHAWREGTGETANAF